MMTLIDEISWQDGVLDAREVIMLLMLLLFRICCCSTNNAAKQDIMLLDLDNSNQISSRAGEH